MPNVLFITHDVVGTHMAGPGIRAAELARVLAREHRVTLATPHAADVLPEGVTGLTYRIGEAASLAPALADADVIVANGFLLGPHPELADAPAPLVLDMYDPIPLENLALFRSADAPRRADQVREDALLLGRQLRAADCLLCATERQRDLYLGALLAAGRLAPAIADADPALRGLLRVVPFGLPETPPILTPPPWNALPPDALVILWSGGLWDWMDPLTLVRAMPQVIAAVPQARLVFLAGQHPGDVYPMQMPERARSLAAELGLLDDSVQFVERWVPYNERAGALLNAALAVYLHEESLESSYAAVRSRFLDHLWCGLPSVVSAGDAAAALVAAHALGRVVPPSDVDATAAALIALLRDASERQACAISARALAAEYTWERVAAPLLDFCREPRRTPDRVDDRRLTTDHQTTDDWREATMRDEQQVLNEDRSPARDTAARDRRARAEDEARNAVLRAAAPGWQLAEPLLPGGVIGRIRALFVTHIVRPFIGPMIAQQNAQNAAIVRALDALAESSDVRRSEMYALLDQLDLQQVALDQRQQERLYALARKGDRLNDRLTNAEQHVGTAEADIGRIDSLLDHTRTTVKDWLIDLDEADTLLAERVAGLSQPKDE